VGLLGRKATDLGKAWSALDRLLSDPDRDPAELSAAMQALGPAIERASPRQRNEVLALMTERARSWPVSRASIAALAAGALVEAGAEPTALHGVVLLRLPGVLVDAARFAAAVARELPEVEEDEEDEEDGDDVLWVGRRRVDAVLLERLRHEDADAAWSWFALDRFCSAACAAAGTDPGRVRDLRTLPGELDTLAEVDGAAAALRDLRDMPLHESFLLVHGPSRRVFELDVDAVRSNFDLHDGAARALARPLGHRAKPGAGLWNVYDWRAAGLDLAKPDGVPRERWIWNEGRPAQVPAFEGTRVLVVGPASYARAWNPGGSAPSVRLVRELPAPEAAALLVRLREAAGA
jgi:hypothetical protein